MYNCIYIRSALCTWMYLDVPGRSWTFLVHSESFESSFCLAGVFLKIAGWNKYYFHFYSTS